MDAVVCNTVVLPTDWYLSRDLTGPAGDDVGIFRDVRREWLDDDYW